MNGHFPGIAISKSVALPEIWALIIQEKMPLMCV